MNVFLGKGLAKPCIKYDTYNFIGLTQAEHRPVNYSCHNVDIITQATK